MYKIQRFLNKSKVVHNAFSDDFLGQTERESGERPCMGRKAEETESRGGGNSAMRRQLLLPAGKGLNKKVPDRKRA